MTRNLVDYNGRQEQLPSGRPEYRAAAISIHGIHTSGKWQKELTPHLQDNAIRYVPLDYGWWPVFRILGPLGWRKALGVRKDIESAIQRQREHTERVWVLAHSFGSFCIGKMLLESPSTRLRGMILCGSILPEDYDWGRVFEQRQVGWVLNEICRKDLVVTLARFAVWGAGRSGSKGFSVKHPSLEQIDNKHSGHSDLLSSAHFQHVWIPKILEL